MMLLFASSIKMIIVLIVCTPVFVKGGGGLNLQPNFQKEEEAWQDLNF